ncbi:Uroporphyrinogen-III methyltransferase [Nitrospira tepida]|uniref:uroporphyrinogen-III C-methyltransferase n=1 Tax=Nitrospira tepida TaxID=2973512 RepID=A0AA86N0C7_9BACT|nr:uroporphyrinogen-III C-methyltransferase [Nitrospira tepida]CAI4032240.1 Uroporphyrinogen-III methyltransferase [Nitrospira tepida]
MGAIAGKIYLVGAGPGDPGLLTLKGKHCLEQADSVFYDYLANPSLLDYARPNAERIYVGRRGRGAYLDQQEINRLIIANAREGKIVVRLKGGDPFVFGRGGEEAEAVAAAGLPFEIVPGVTSATAVPAYAGIPVTHRTLASTVAFVTGHEDPNKETELLEWPKLATAQGTLVFLMGLKNLPLIVDRLIKEGRSAETPVALIHWGSWPKQRTVTGTLRDIVAKGQAAGLEPPTTVVIGEVVRLRDQLNWFERQPLFGKRILVTRAKEQAGEFSRLITAQGGEPVECPTIEIAAPPTWEALDQAIDQLASVDWLVFTSMNGIAPFMNRLYKHGRDVRALASVKICCIGPRTAQELRQYGLQADLVPDEYQAEGLIESFRRIGVKGRRILIPRAEVAREMLPAELTAMGAEVTVVPVYRTVKPEADTARLTKRLADRTIDMLTFTSSSTVRNFASLFESPEEMVRLTQGVPVACIGPITADTARELGLSVTIQAGENTIPALAEAIVEYYGESVPDRSKT